MYVCTPMHVPPWGACMSDPRGEGRPGVVNECESK